MSHYKIKIPMKYVPKYLTVSDKNKQIKQLAISKKLYKKGKFYTRTKLHSFKNKQSKHIINARRIYNIQNIRPTAELARATGCSLHALKQIVNKGAGAYYSSGSRPNQTPLSWGLARLASSITAGKSAAIDFHIIHNGCLHHKPAFRLAKKSIR